MADPPGAAPRLLALVLAGGSSQRLGCDKASVPFEGATLLERSVQLLSRFVAEVSVSVRPDQVDDDLRRRFPLVVDRRPAIGPAAGLLAAHRQQPDAAWLVLACDMPWVTEREIAVLVGSRDGSRAATAFRRVADGVPEPLCAIYEPATLARFQAEVDAGGNPSPRDWLAAVDAVLLDPPQPGALASINTPADLQRLGGRHDRT
jgi:molybdopterin-guanine dinucleotide biosynthesis protein A